MTISDAVLRIWMAKAQKALRRYHDHAHFDDLVASAYLAMWEALLGAEEGAVRNLEGYAMRAAWNGALAYLSSPANEHRTYDIFHQKPVTPPLYLEDVRAGRYDEYHPGRLIEPDFAPPLIATLALLEELARLPPRKRAALLLCCLQGLTRDEACAQLGWSRDQIYRVLKGVSRDAIPYAHPGSISRQETCPRCGQPKAGDNVTLQGRCRSCRNARNRERWHKTKTPAG